MRKNILKKSIFSVLISLILGLLLLVPVQAQAKTYASGPSTRSAIELTYGALDAYEPFPLVIATSQDDRVARIDQYFIDRTMPLAGHGDVFVAAADQCGMDWRLLPAISVRESSGGKHLLNNNPFGWGSAKIPFADFDEAIAAVANNLCGLNPATARYYENKSSYEKLWSYNGTVMASYPSEVMAIMEKI